MVDYTISLREMKPADAELLLEWENNPENWEISETSQPFTKEQIEAFVNQPQSLKENKQQRFIICLADSPIGCIDLFEYDDDKKKAGIGVLIAEKINRNKGYASQALNLLKDRCRNELNIVYLFCNITSENTASIRLFEKCGFQFVEEQQLDGQSVNYYELKEC